MIRKTLAALLCMGVAIAAAEAAEVKIGFVTTLTTPAAVIGEDMRNSVELALEQMGGKMGDLDVKVIYEDDGFKPEMRIQVIGDTLNKTARAQVFRVDRVEGSVLVLKAGDVLTDEADVARASAHAGADLEMATHTYLEHLPRLVESGVVPLSLVDDAVRRILRVKHELGLFEEPLRSAPAASVLYWRPTVSL